jgi:hypothetical protein
MKINPLLRNMHTLLTENIDGKISMIMRVKKTGLKEADILNCIIYKLIFQLPTV